MEREVLLHVVDGRKVVVLDLAELEEAKANAYDLSCYAQLLYDKVIVPGVQSWGCGTDFSQDLGAKSTSRSITISPTEVSRSTLILFKVGKEVPSASNVMLW